MSRSLRQKITECSDMFVLFIHAVDKNPLDIRQITHTVLVSVWYLKESYLCRACINKTNISLHSVVLLSEVSAHKMYYCQANSCPRPAHELSKNSVMQDSADHCGFPSNTDSFKSILNFISIFSFISQSPVQPGGHNLSCQSTASRSTSGQGLFGNFRSICESLSASRPEDKASNQSTQVSHSIFPLDF